MSDQPAVASRDDNSLTGANTPEKRSLWGRFLVWARRHRLRRKLTVTLSVLAALSSIATYGAMSSPESLLLTPGKVLWLMLLNLALLLALLGIVARGLVRLWQERKRGAAGSRLHTRLVALFSFVAVTPAVLVAGFTIIFFQQGVQAWFNDLVRQAVYRSVQVAQAYEAEHEGFVRAEMQAMAKDMERRSLFLSQNPAAMADMIAQQAAIRELSNAVVFTAQGDVLARIGFLFDLNPEDIPPEVLDRAAKGELIIATSPTRDQIKGLMRLSNYVDTYLYVGRYVDPIVLRHADTARKAAERYQTLEQQRSSIEINFSLIFMVVAVLMLVVAITFGLTLASRLVEPINALVIAAERVRAGDLSARVAEPKDDTEMGTLSRVFNRMTEQLGSQKQELMEAHRQSDERRRFIESVLGGISSGVIGIDEAGVITLANSSAETLLEFESDSLPGRVLMDAVPESAELLDQARENMGQSVRGEIKLNLTDGLHILLAQISSEGMSEHHEGFVVTFDDITDLMEAQRKSAWGDVARRIAHEIKNPLTPIQLSAERLKRKYGKEITSPDVFEKCTDTIIRQVGDMRRMVDEFSAFARMPHATFKMDEVTEVVRQAIFLQQVGHNDITFGTHLPDGKIHLACDSRLLSQALTNVLKNAAESVEQRLAEQGNGDTNPGSIEVTIHNKGAFVTIEVVDNGVGLPAELRGRLTEPYVTKKAKGTGLGLAIVRKIMEDHGGSLKLTDNPTGGAIIRLRLRSDLEPSQDITLQQPVS